MAERNIKRRWQILCCFDYVCSVGLSMISFGRLVMYQGLIDNNRPFFCDAGTPVDCRPRGYRRIIALKTLSGQKTCAQNQSQLVDHTGISSYFCAQNPLGTKTCAQKQSNCYTSSLFNFQCSASRDKKNALKTKATATLNHFSTPMFSSL